MKGIQGKNILVSGCESFLGSLIALRLIELGADVSIICNDENNLLLPAAYLKQCSVVSINDVEEDNKLPRKIDAILFLNNPVILPNNQIGDEFHRVELSSLLKLLRLAGRQASYFLYASSVAAYGKQKYIPIDEEHPLEPMLLYGAAKMAGECYLRASALETGFFYSVLRYGDLYGPGNRYLGAPSVFLENAIKGKPFLIKGAGRMVRSYLYIDDAVEATINVLIGQPVNNTINIAGNEYISIWHLANLIKQNYSVGCEIEISNNILLDEMECCINSERAKNLFGFQPKVDLEKGLTNTYNWLLNAIGAGVY